MQIHQTILFNAMHKSELVDDIPLKRLVDEE